MAATEAHCTRCGVVFRTMGNLGGHCTGRDCHRTFRGLSAFDRHQTISEGGKVTCHDPAEMMNGAGEPLYRAIMFDGDPVTYWGLRSDPWDPAAAFRDSE